MALNIEQMDYVRLYKFLDEKEAYFAHGVWYVCKYNNPKSSKEPIIYVYHFDLNGKVVAIYCGNLIKYDYQNGVEFSLKGWKVDKDSSISNVGSKETIEELTFSVMTLTELDESETSIIREEILCFLDDPMAYLNNKRK